MDFEGKPQKWNTIWPHGYYEQRTSDTHKWTVQKLDNEGKKLNFNGGHINGDNWYKI